MAHGDYTHVEIPADDPARAQRFYGDLFGWKFMAVPDFPDYHLYTTAAGEEAVGGAIGKRDVTAPGAIRNYVSVDSLEESEARVEELGGTVVTHKTEVPGMGWYAVVRDTEGNELGLWQRADR